MKSEFEEIVLEDTKQFKELFKRYKNKKLEDEEISQFEGTAIYPKRKTERKERDKKIKTEHQWNLGQHLSESKHIIDNWISVDSKKIFPQIKPQAQMALFVNALFVNSIRDLMEKQYKFYTHSLEISLKVKRIPTTWHESFYSQVFN